MPLIQVDLQTDDEQMKELCQLYWQTDDEGKFIHNTGDFCGRFNLKSREVASVVRQHCRAYKVGETCAKCGKPVRFLENRSDFSARWRVKEYCDNCMAEIAKEQNEIRKKQIEIARQEKERKMQEAFEGGVYESLTLLELNFLVALVTSTSSEIARKKVGISKEDASALIKKLNDLHLINWNVGIEGYSVLGELDEALQKIGLQRRVKSVFGSPKAQEVYKKLKAKYLFVYPEIPICAFIDREQVEHLFTESWHSSYFLMARLDFVVCDPDGKPNFAIEYQGGYHKGKEQQEKDEFKKMILQEVGITILPIDSKSLQNLDTLL